MKQPTGIPLPNKKGCTTKQKKKSSTQYRLNTIFLDNVNHYRWTNSLSDLRNFLLPCILRKLMRCSVVISFHMFDFPATKRRKRTKCAFGKCILHFSRFFFFFFFQRLWTVTSTVHALCGDEIYCSCTVYGTHNHFIKKKNIKNESHGTIHIFKNYFATVFFSFQFSVVSKRTLSIPWYTCPR